jgi:5-enolpyruvylshikimate-3-phosphate synthase
MSKNNIVRPVGAKPTQEEMEAQAKRAFLQKRNSIAEGILFNAVSSGQGIRIDGNGRPDFKPAVAAAIEAADEYMRLALGIEAKVKEEAE